MCTTLLFINRLTTYIKTLVQNDITLTNVDILHARNNKNYSDQIKTHNFQIWYDTSNKDRI
jgi:hypothetical protein